MSDPQLTIPDVIIFEQALDITHSLLELMEQGKVSDPEVQALITQLVRSENGARGFFVTYLTDERSFADQPTDTVIQALQSSPDLVSDLLVKNLAMSTAMAITHRRQNNERMAQGSDRVQRRTMQLMQSLSLPELVQRVQQLHESATTGAGDYQPLLDRWHYDAEQRQAIRQVAEQVMEL